MNPGKFSQMMKYLTRAKKANPELPDVTFADKISQPPVRQDVELKNAINAFIRRERQQKAGGGMLVQPGFGGTRQGYAESREIKSKKEGKYENVYKNAQGNYVYRSGSGEDRIYKSGFKTPEAASKWGQKEFVKKFSLPNKFVNAAELSKILGFGSGTGSGMQSPFFERGDRPRYLLQEARKILGSYKSKGSNFFRAPTKKEIEYLKKYNTSPIIPNQVAKNVQLILDSKAIMNDLTGKNKGGKKLPDFKKIQKVFANAGIEASDAVIANALQKAAYLLRGDSYQTTVNFNKDKATGNFIIKEIEKLPFDNQYTRGIYKHALQEISKELGDTAGNLDSFKRNFRKRLPEDFLEKHNLNVNEIFSVRASVRNKSYPYAYFIDVIDADINQKALRSFHGALSNAQTTLNNKIKDVRAGKAKYDDLVEIVEKFNRTRDKFKETIKTNYGNKPFNLPNIVLGKESEILKSNMKIPADVYSKKLLDKWQNQGLDITGHAKKTGYVMTGAADKGVFTAQDLSRNPEIRKQAISEIENNLLQKIGCPGLASGGRAGFDVGTNCKIKGANLINSGMKNASPAQIKNFAAFANRTASLGRGVMKFGVIPEALFVAADSLIRMGMGDNFNEAFLRASDYLRPGDQAKQAEMLEADRFFGPEVAGIIGKSMDYKNQLTNVQSLEDQKANLENLSGGGTFDYIGDLSQDIKNIDARLKQETDNLNKFKMTDAEQIYADRMQQEVDDARSSGSFFTKLKSRFRNVGDDYSDVETLGMPEQTQKQLNQKILPAFGDSKDFITMSTADAINLAQAYRAQGSNVSAKDILAYRDSLRNSSLSDLAQQFNPESVYGASGTMGEPINKPPMEKPQNVIGDMEKEIVGQTNVANPFDLDISDIGTGLRGFAAAEGGVASGPPPVRGPNPQGLLSLKNRVRNY